MVQSLSSGKAAAWRRRVRRFERAGMTVERFCEEEGVSASTFYRWRKKLAGRRTPIRDGNHATVFQAVRVTPADTPLAIQLPGGVRVEVPTANLDAVRAVLGELLRHDAARDRGESSC